MKTLLRQCLVGVSSTLLLIYTGMNVAKEIPEVKNKPWMNTSLSAEQRTQLLLKEMTLDEKLSLLVSYFGNPLPEKNFTPPIEARSQSAGFTYGVPRLGIPHIWLADAGLGVASQRGPKPRERTGLPSGLNTAATWNPELAYAAGKMIGSEARTSGFNVLLAGSVNLQREPRNGRNFEYAGEDPLLAGIIVGQQIKGVQSNNIVSTLKHFAYNDQETGRGFLNVTIDEAAGRMSDLLALQIAYEIGQPGSVMCAYNRVYGVYACESDYLLNQVLKNEWGFKGWVMSDWGATHSTIPAANNGLDQQSGLPFDHSDYFKAPLKEAVMNGWVSQARFDDMVARILFALFDKGVMDNPVAAPSDAIDFKKHNEIVQASAEEGMVLLKNEGLLPLDKNTKKIAIIGSYADKGVLSGGGSSQVYPVSGMVIQGLGPKEFPGPIVYLPSSPMKALAKLMPSTQFNYDEGTDLKAAAKLAATSDIAIVFVNQWTAESIDELSLSLPNNQDALVAAVAKANTKTIVVLETGGPVLMPWLKTVNGILAAWYPGVRGGQAIARVLTGEVNPSGHLPITFPASEKQLPREILDGDPKRRELRFDVNYFEGEAVGYKWFEKKELQPLFPFGHGLSYTSFAHAGLKMEQKDKNIKATFSINNTGKFTGKEVAQLYVQPLTSAWEVKRRLAGFQKTELKPGEKRELSIDIDPRLLGVYDSKTKTWRIAAGNYEFTLATSSVDSQVSAVLKLPEISLDVRGK
jgi:beta-glucosidase